LLASTRLKGVTVPSGSRSGFAAPDPESNHCPVRNELATLVRRSAVLAGS